MTKRWKKRKNRIEFGIAHAHNDNDNEIDNDDDYDDDDNDEECETRDRTIVLYCIDVHTYTHIPEQFIPELKKKKKKWLSYYGM